MPASIFSRASSGLIELMRPIILLTFILAFAFTVAGQNVQPGFDLSNYGVRIDADKRLIVVLAALEMAEAKTEAACLKRISALESSP